MGITKQHKNVQIMALFKRKAREHSRNSFSTEPAQLFVYIHKEMSKFVRICPFSLTKHLKHILSS